MNNIKLNQTGGFPLDTDTLEFMQSAYSIFNSLGELAGNYAILKGCTVTGTTVTDGKVYLSGEVLDFKGGTISTNVLIKEDNTTAEFENGETKTTEVTRYVTFGSGGSGNTFTWSNFKRITSILELAGRILPAKTNPQLYCGSVNAIPTGWQLCDGTNGTPDLKGQFIVGYDPADADYNTIGNKGGLKEVNLTAAQNGSHDHTATTSNAGSHVHNGITVKGSNRDNGDPGKYIVTSPDEANGNQTNDATTGTAGDHVHLVTIASSGEGKAHENRPPYYTLAYIIYVGS